MTLEISLVTRKIGQAPESILARITRDLATALGLP